MEHCGPSAGGVGDRGVGGVVFHVEHVCGVSCEHDPWPVMGPSPPARAF